MSGKSERDGYWIYEWDEECSALTPGARWVPGTEYHSLRVRMWIPNSITSEEDVERYVEEHCDDEDAYVDDAACLTCGREFSSFNPHFGGGVCRSCWSTSH